MKTISLTTIISLLCFAGQAQAQTDITNTYLTNTGFDDSSSWVTTNVSQPAAETVTGWVSPTSASWCASGSANFGSTYTINGNTVPATNSNGSTSGGCLYMRLGWGANYAYTQNITLPAGFYRLSYKVYNNGGAENVAANNTGFTTSNGIRTLGPSIASISIRKTPHQAPSASVIRLLAMLVPAAMPALPTTISNLRNSTPSHLPQRLLTSQPISQMSGPMEATLTPKTE